MYINISVSIHEIKGYLIFYKVKHFLQSNWRSFYLIFWAIKSFFFRYNWQWDYVQKYAETNKKNVIGFNPKEDYISTTNYKTADVPAEEEPKKAKNEGIKLKMQMLQQKFSSNKTSLSMKQKIYERDLELDILKRRKTYKNLQE